VVRQASPPGRAWANISTGLAWANTSTGLARANISTGLSVAAEQASQCHQANALPR